MKKLFAMLLLASMSLGVVSSSFALPLPQAKHLKKDGTADKRFKNNTAAGPTTKSGKPDMRYKSNNPKAGKTKGKK